MQGRLVPDVFSQDAHSWITTSSTKRAVSFSLISSYSEKSIDFDLRQFKPPTPVIKSVQYLTN